MYRLEDQGLTLRLFRNAREARDSGLFTPHHYGCGFIAKNRYGRWMDSHGPLPMEWEPSTELLRISQDPVDVALRVCSHKNSRTFSGSEINIFATSEQFDEMVKQLVANKVGRLLTALNILDHGCAKPGFKDWQNGHGAPVGDEVQAALDELTAFVGHVTVLDIETDD